MRKWLIHIQVLHIDWWDTIFWEQRQTETTVLFDTVFLFYKGRSGFHSSDAATGWNSQLTPYKLLPKGSFPLLISQVLADLSNLSPL